MVEDPKVDSGERVGLEELEVLVPQGAVEVKEVVERLVVALVAEELQREVPQGAVEVKIVECLVVPLGV